MTILLEAPPRALLHGEDVVVVTRDPFGHRLAAALAPGTGATPYDPDDPRLGDAARGVVVAGARPDTLLLRTVSGEAWRRGLPLLPVTVDGPHLVVGPYVVPGESACLRCYRRRVRQHDPAAESSAHLAAAYDADPSLRPGGWLPALAQLAAGIVATTLAGDAAGLAPGEVRMLDVLTLVPSRGAVVGFTGCPDCDTSDTARRSWAELAAAWPALLGSVR